MAGTEIYLAIKGGRGDIAGEAIAEGFVGQINVDSWKWQLNSNVSYINKREAARAAGSRARFSAASAMLEARLKARMRSSDEEEEMPDEPQPEDLPADDAVDRDERPVFSVNKRTDLSTIGLMRAMFSGEFLELQLTMLHRVEQALSVVVIFKRARVQKVKFSTKAAEGPVGLDEEVEFVAEVVEFRYQKRGDRSANRVYRMVLDNDI